jgi:hypothetical protein
MQQQTWWHKGQLVTLTVYKRAAAEVVRRLAA